LKEKIVIAIGGNAIISEGQKGTVEEQYANISKMCPYIADLIEDGYRIILTHGNGPQVGNILLQSEAAKDRIPVLPIDVCVAETQGQLGYMIKQSLDNLLRERGIKKDVVSVLSRVLVDENDPAFKEPTKPIGPFYSKEEADKIAKTKNHAMVEDSGRGYRRVVPSPRPLDIIEQSAVKILADSGTIVITVGGGGIPVAENNGMLKGIEAVIDKDYASSLLGNQIDADFLVILTGVPQVAINFGKPNQKFLSKMSLEEAKKYYEEGQFPKGSMGPKIEAGIEYLDRGGKKVIITSLDYLKDAIEGKAGTVIMK
jgi:carbamate kinase